MTRRLLSGWLCNANRNLQHTIADRQSNFQACLIDRSSISPFRINDLRVFNVRDIADCDKSPNLPRSLTGFSSIAVKCEDRFPIEIEHAEKQMLGPRHRELMRLRISSEALSMKVT